MNETATFGAGCFWGVEMAFARVEGVRSTVVGYAGGHLADPTYRDVCSGSTGHTEVVQVRFDPEIVSYPSLLEVFWSAHDPTQVNRQGPDIGYQYRSVIFVEDEAQRASATESLRHLERSGRVTRPVATSIEPASCFYAAEEYHQQYLAKRGMVHCAV